MRGWRGARQTGGDKREITGEAKKEAQQDRLTETEGKTECQRLTRVRNVNKVGGERYGDRSYIENEESITKRAKRAWRSEEKMRKGRVGGKGSYFGSTPISLGMFLPNSTKMRYSRVAWW